MSVKLDKLASFLKSKDLLREADRIAHLIKSATPIPPGEDITPGSHRFINLEGPDAMSSKEIEENLKLKDIFIRRKDDSFISQFQFIHFFRGTPGEALDFMQNVSAAPNSTEMSVVGFRGNVCDAVKNPHFGSNSYIFLMEGTPVSAFYFDATSSLTKGFIDSESYQAKLRDLGVDIEDNLPKVVNISDGQLHNFFYDEHSYLEASDGRRSDYHEFILRGARVKNLILDSKMRLDRFYETLAEEIEYDGEIIQKIKICEGGTIHDSDIAREKLIQSSKKFTYRDGWRNRSTYWNGEKFENIIESLNEDDDDYIGDIVGLEMALEEVVATEAMEIENIDSLISSMVDFAGHKFSRFTARSGDDWLAARERHIRAFLRHSLKSLVAKNMHDINGFSNYEDNFSSLLFGNSYVSKEYGVRDIVFEEMAEKGLGDLSSIISANFPITEDNIEDLSYEIDKFYTFLFETSYSEDDGSHRNVRFSKWDFFKEKFLDVLRGVVRTPDSKREFKELVRAYQDSGERNVPYSFIKEHGVLYGARIVGPIPEANEIMSFAYTKE